MKKLITLLCLRVLNFFAPFNYYMYMFFLIPLLKFAGMKINGKPTFISQKCSFDDFNRITIGDKVRFAKGVKFLIHDYSYTTMMIAKNEFEGKGTARLSRIVIGNNVFIGIDAIIMPGTVVGDDVIIGAGAVVRGKIESRQVVLGNPAKPVMTIDELYDRTMSKADSLELRIDRF